MRRLTATAGRMSGFDVLDCRDMADRLAAAARMPCGAHGAEEMRPALSPFQRAGEEGTVMPVSPPGGPPDRITPTRLGDYLEVMSKAVFQSGMSWKVVESKWPELRVALREFDAEEVAALTPQDLEALTQDRRVIRNRRKLAAIAGNAQRMLELERVHGSFRRYLRSHADFNATLEALRADFKFVGEMGGYYFLYVVGEEVPPHEEFQARRRKPAGRRRPRKRAAAGGGLA